MENTKTGDTFEKYRKTKLVFKSAWEGGGHLHMKFFCISP